jgi:hypothetical protein
MGFERGGRGGRGGPGGRGGGSFRGGDRGGRGGARGGGKQFIPSAWGSQHRDLIIEGYEGS